MPGGWNGHGSTCATRPTPRKLRAPSMQIPHHLRLVTDAPECPGPECEDLAALDALCRSFAQATGWELEYFAPDQTPPNASLSWSAPVEPGVGVALGHLGLRSSAESGSPPRVPLPQAGALAGAVAGLWTELVATRVALWQREAELAAGVPVTWRPAEPLKLAARLEGALRAATEGIGCDAAALYLLDAGTTSLKLRASWNLPTRRLLAPPRPLRGSVADLEALLGHAVALTETELLRAWRPPEPCGAAVCVPVSTAATPLGTLWVFSRAARDFSDAQTNLVELAAGRIAVELERQMLLEENASARARADQFDAAADAWQFCLPAGSPQLAGWTLAASSRQAGRLGGAWHDWFALPAGGLGVACGVGACAGLPAALAAPAARAAVRTAGRSSSDPAAWMQAANAALWSGSSGEQQAGLATARIEPDTATVHLSLAAPLRGLVAGRAGIEPLAAALPAPGAAESVESSEVAVQLSAGERLFLFGRSTTPPATTAAAWDEAVAACAQQGFGQPIDEVVDQIAAALAAAQPDGPLDQVVLGLAAR